MKIIGEYLLIYILIFHSQGIFAQQHLLKSAGFSNGAGTAESASYKSIITLGQPFAGKTLSTSYTMDIGFLPTAIPRSPELRFSEANVTPTILSPGEEFSLTFILENTGGVNAKGEVGVGVYLSTNSSYDAHDETLDMFVATNDLASGATAPFPEEGQPVKSITIPASTTLGSYHVFIVVDPDNTIKEINENNNVFGIAVTISKTAKIPLNISDPSHSKVGDDYEINVTVTGGSGPLTVTFNMRGILEEDYHIDTITSFTDLYQVTISVSELDEIGMEYFFNATDTVVQSPVQSRLGFIYSDLEEGEKTILGLSSGGEVEDYRIISIPYDMEDNLVLSIFGVLGEYDISKWRLIRYQKGKNVDYPTFNRIIHGWGYWFNSLDPVEISLSAGTAPKFHQDNPFVLSLAQGYNQIGNPYPFDIQWSAVQAANSGKQIGALKVYDPSTTNTIISEDLKVWSGGFVFADDPVQLNFPVTLISSGGGRIAGSNIHVIEKAYLDHEAWFVPLTLTHGKGVNSMTGLGMHPEASASKDMFDDITVPRFFSYLELNSHHPEFFAPDFSRDVVPYTENYTWEFSMYSNFEGPIASLQWDASAFGNNDCLLLLHDVPEQRFIDMKKSGRYDFSPRDGRKFKFIYAKDKDTWQSEFTLLGSPYPNPANDQIHIPLMIKNNEHIKLEVIDIMGKRIKTLNQGALAGGLHTITWNCNNESSVRVSPGIYVVRLASDKNHQLKKILVR